MTRLSYYKKIRSYLRISLVFSFLLAACKENKKEDQQVSIQWEGNKATAIIIPRSLLDGTPIDSALQLVYVQLENSGADMLGDNSSTTDAILFQPIIPFTPGLRYKVYVAGKLITTLKIPVNENAAPPVIISIYPSGRDVPENLLKMYIVFSKPMQEGHAMENIVMILNEKDTIPVFFDLQQELWNKERTILTLWLDPGRIKRGLQPNEKTGIPLQRGQDYRLVVKSGWRDTEGQTLNALYSQYLVVGERDSILPSIDRWEIIPPKAGSRDAIKIKLHEQLDYLLLKNAIRIIDENGNSFPGTIGVEADETEISFIPVETWHSGNYSLEAEARLEDLAGNNLNRLFDEDISTKKNTEQKPIHKRSFRIQ